eukprot:TRINITY_DN3452_c1_g1_i1.p1 TRINITY_DN3452_c1_g1~~TRINITY_DN3452_c1_g1_i1.p1  ORF type:complete len:307 (+),score=97.25 TRINITY_DN3452_c1_g1_i1:134-1054(+)
MRSTRAFLFRQTGALLGGGDNPYIGWSRWGWPSSYGSDWQLHEDIRHPADNKWGPSRYGGNVTPSMAEFMLDLNPGHPTIDPLYHPKLTHKQKMVRLYRKALHEMMGILTRQLQRDILGFYMRQIRAEFEKNRHVDQGSAEWLFVRANEYIENKKHQEGWYQDYYPSRVYWARYFMPNPDHFVVFPHGFDPDEALKLQNPYHRFGIPYRPRWLHLYAPQAYMITPAWQLTPAPWHWILTATGWAINIFLFTALLAWMQIGNYVPAGTKPEWEANTGADGLIETRAGLQPGVPAGAGVRRGSGNINP